VAHSESVAPSSWTIPTTGLLLLNFSGPMAAPAVASAPPVGAPALPPTSGSPASAAGNVVATARPSG
jgi:hypothetical protein